MAHRVLCYVTATVCISVHAEIFSLVQVWTLAFSFKLYQAVNWLSKSPKSKSVI